MEEHIDKKLIPKCPCSGGHYEDSYIRGFGEVFEDLLAVTERRFTIDSLETDRVFLEVPRKEIEGIGPAGEYDTNEYKVNHD